MKTKLTKKQAGREMAEILMTWYVGNKNDITVGFTDEGEIDYEYDSFENFVSIPVYQTRNGWTLGGDEDPTSPDFWTEETLDWIGEILTNEAPIDDDGWPIEIDYAIDWDATASAVKELRHRNGWNTAALADRCGVSPRTVEGWEQGRPIPAPALRLLQLLATH